jgi:hypothetical protein
MYISGKVLPAYRATDAVLRLREAAKWFRLASDQGYAKARVRLGFVYEEGAPMPQDSAEAMKLFRQRQLGLGGIAGFRLKAHVVSGDIQGTEARKPVELQLVRHRRLNRAQSRTRHADTFAFPPAARAPGRGPGCSARKSTSFLTNHLASVTLFQN